MSLYCPNTFWGHFFMHKYHLQNRTKCIKSINEFTNGNCYIKPVWIAINMTGNLNTELHCEFICYFVERNRKKKKIKWHTFIPSVSRTHLEQGKLKTNLNYQPKSIFYAWISNQIIWVTVWGCFWVLFSSRLRLRDWIESNPIKSGTTYFKTQSNAAGPSGAFTERIMPAKR